MRPRGQSDSSVFGSRRQPAPGPGVGQVGSFDIGPRLGDPPLGIKALAGLPNLQFPVRKIAMRHWMRALNRLDCHHPHWADYRLFGEMLGFDYQDIEHMATQQGGPTFNIFRVWYTQDGATVESLVYTLHQMNRADIIEDVVDIVREYHRTGGRRKSEEPGHGYGKDTERNTFLHWHDFLRYHDAEVRLRRSQSVSKSVFRQESDAHRPHSKNDGDNDGPSCGCSCHQDRPRPTTPPRPHSHAEVETHTERHFQMTSSSSRHTHKRGRSRDSSVSGDNFFMSPPWGADDPEDDFVYHFCMLVRSLSGMLQSIHRRVHSAYAEPIDWSLMSTLFFLLAYAKEWSLLLLSAHMMVSIAGCQFLDIVLDFILMAILLVQIYENKIVSKEVKEMRHYVTTTRRTVLNGDGSQTVTDHQEVSVVELRMRTKVGELQESIRMKLISFIIVEALLVMWSIWVMFWYLTFQMTHLIGVLVCTGELVLMVTVWSIHYRRADPQLLYGRFACTWDEDQALELDQQECADKAALSHSPTSEKEECIPHPEHRVSQPSLGPSPAVSEPEITMDTEL